MAQYGLQPGWQTASGVIDHAKPVQAKEPPRSQRILGFFAAPSTSKPSLCVQLASVLRKCDTDADTLGQYTSHTACHVSGLRQMRFEISM